MSATDQTPLETPPIQPIPIPNFNLPVESFDPTPFEYDNNYTAPFERRIYEETNIWFPKDPQQSGGSRAMYRDNRHPSPYQLQPLEQVGGMYVPTAPPVAFGQQYLKRRTGPSAKTSQLTQLNFDVNQLRKPVLKGSGSGVPGQKVMYRYETKPVKPLEQRFLPQKTGYAYISKQ